MDTQKRQKIIYLLFAIAVIWGIYNFMGTSTPTTADTPKPAAGVVANKTVPQTAAIDVKTYSTLEWGRDPFYRGKKQQFQPTVKPTKSHWLLGGILYDNKRPSAVINKKVVRGGDIINGARVVQINKETVTLDKEGLQFTLTIAKDKS